MPRSGPGEQCKGHGMSASNVLTRLAATLLALGLCASAHAEEPPPADAGAVAERAAPTRSDNLTRPRKARYIDPRFDPIAMVRMSFVYTMEDTITETADDGSALEIDSTRMDPSPFGHRQGFVMENVELGFAGRFNRPGIYYKVKFELVPREKDGNRSTDFLRDAYLGWDNYAFFDVRAGRMKIPFSRANLTSTEHRAFIYAPTFDTLIPKRQVGLRLSGGDPEGIFRIHGGVYNAVTLAVEQMKTLDRLLFVGRAELNIDELLASVGVKLGPEGEDDWADFQIAGSAAWVQENFDPPTEHRWLGLDMLVKVWRLELAAELVYKDFYESALLDGSQASQRGWGWNVDLGVSVIEDWLDLNLRVEQSDGDDFTRGFNTSLTIDETSRQKKRWITAGVTTHFYERAQLKLNYIHREELEGFSFDNDVILLMFQYAM